MRFGLKMAPITFQRVMDNIIRGIQNVLILVYMDDIVCYSTIMHERISRLTAVFKRIQTQNSTGQIRILKKVVYLEHLITVRSYQNSFPVTWFFSIKNSASRYAYCDLKLDSYN